MSDFIPPKPTGVKVGGLGPKAQKLQALREKMAAQASAKSGGKPVAGSTNASFKAKSNGPTKKTAFQRKAT